VRDHIRIVMSIVYHFTCTFRLPWIIAAAELRPGRNQSGNYPSPDFLWATTIQQGDRTSAAWQSYRQGSALVRLTVPAEDFELWPDITSRFPQWTQEDVRRLEHNAQHFEGISTISGWRARVEPLPISRVIKAEAKTYTGQWRPIALECIPGPVRDPQIRAVEFNGTVYYSMQVIDPGRPTMYPSGKLSVADWKRTGVIAA
jgi:hypothetical protein